MDKTILGGTETQRGLVHHYHHEGLDFPVAIEVDNRRAVTDKHGTPIPVHNGEMMVFATPGGGRIVRKVKM